MIARRIRFEWIGMWPQFLKRGGHELNGMLLLMLLGRFEVGLQNLLQLGRDDGLGPCNGFA